MKDEDQSTKPKENVVSKDTIMEERQPPPKKQKIHKRKLKKMNAKPQLSVVRAPISVSDVRNLVQELTKGQNYTMQKSVSIKEAQKISRVVVCYAPGILRTDVQVDPTTGISSLGKANETEKLKFFYDNAFQAAQLKYPGKANEVFSAQKVLINKEIKNSEKTQLLKTSADEGVSIEDLLVKMPDWMDHDYTHFPGSGQNLPDDWFQTEKLNKEAQMLALDCEFCQTKTGSQLARISVVDFENNVLYDEFVKPEEEIIDYKTRFSGITEKMMNKATTTQSEVRDKLRSLISASDILVGHSLSFDLNVLKMVHHRVVDTCVIYDHPRKKPYKASLKWLTETYLNRKIQEGEQTNEGHSSVEDCIACLDLVKLKLSKSVLFGQEPDSVPISAELAQQSNNMISIVDTSIGDWGVAQSYSKTLNQVVAEDEDDVVEKIASSTTKISYCSLSDCPPHADDSQKAKLFDRLSKIWDSLPENSLFIIIGGNEVSPDIDELQKVKSKFRWMQKQNQEVTDPAQIWDFNKTSTLKRLVEEAKKSVSLFGLKVT